VKPDTVVGLIEAMKLFNDVTAGCTGTIAEVCVENQQGVEFNTVLFKVDLSS
jgi:acetyl-CoA carboxylase biotin carboxyl carrier protein